MKMLPSYRRFPLALLALASSLAQAQSSDEFTYVAKKGDNLITIGKTLLDRPADWAKLVKPNRIANPRQIQPGREIRIPLALLRSEPLQAEVVRSVGEVRSGANTPVAAGDRISEGGTLRTGRDGYVTLRLVDGSTLTVQRQSELALQRLRTYAGAQVVASDLRLDSGRVEAAVRARSPGSSRFEVRSRLASAAVRGTDFRVGVQPGGNAMTAEVISGTVAFSGTSQPGAVVLGAGFGSAIEAGAAPRPPVALLGAPDLSAFAPLQERPVVRLRFAQVAGARSYRAQVAADSEFQSVLREEQFQTPDVRLVDLIDGDYHVRVRAVDEIGIEGRDSAVAMRLKARPEPPFPSAPVPQGKVRGTEVRMEWTSNPDASSYRLQVAADTGFQRIVRNESGLPDPRITLSGIPNGEYHWRLSSTRGAGDHGPWGDAQRFNLLPPPADPEPAKEEADAFAFRWPGEPGQRFAVEIGRDAAFNQILLRQDTAEPMLRVPRPSPGTYYLRVRATDPDGFVGPYTRAQRFEVKAVGLVDSAGRPVPDSQARPVGTRTD